MRKFDPGQQSHSPASDVPRRARWLTTSTTLGQRQQSRPGGPIAQLGYTDGVARGGSGGGKRYVGRSASRPAPRRISQPLVKADLPAPLPIPTSTQQSPAVISRPRVVPWSVRLVACIIIICSVGVAARLMGVLTPPVDAPSGVEATHAAFAYMLAGRVEGATEGVRMWPPPAPWQGIAPTNPTAGLPVYGWVTSLVMRYLGAGDWIARVFSILFSLLAGLALFSVVRRTAGVRAGLYSLLLYSLAPLSIIIGQQVSPASMLLVAQAGALLGLVAWRETARADAPQGSVRAFAIALIAGACAALLDPGSIFLAVPAAYLILGQHQQEHRPLYSRRKRPAGSSWREVWQNSPNRGKLIGYAGTLAGASLIWWVFTSGSEAVTLAAGDGGGGVGVALGALLQASTYAQTVGLLIEKVLTIAGLLLLAAGLLHGARPPMQMLFHAWLGGGLLHVLADASRLGRHDDVLLPLLLPVCALVGVGAAWSGSFPARIWLAVTEHKRERESDYSVSPHTAWLLDLPEERADTDKPSRPQAQLALGKSVAERARKAGARARRTWLIGFGHLLILGAFALMAASGWKSASARLQPTPTSVELREAGAAISGATPGDARLIVAGPHAPELFYSSARTGWVLGREEFNIGTVQALQREGASYLLSADQEWLGRQPDYRGLLANYSVKQLTRTHILFDLNTKPAQSDRLYFLESGHTLGGDFRRFWESRGGVQKLGYPISEEMQEVNPLDGQTRLVQYFERAVLEHHPEFAGTDNVVMLASVGLWVTQGRDFPRAAPFENTPDRAYFPETGHTLKEAFLRFWLREGGLAMFGYPISEELPEISSGDGKVYTVQYFERARLEWHPTEAGTPQEVQLGLIGKQALEMRR